MKRYKIVWVKKNPWWMKSESMNGLMINWYMPVRKKIINKCPVCGYKIRLSTLGSFERHKFGCKNKI